MREGEVCFHSLTKAREQGEARPASGREQAAHNVRKAGHQRRPLPDAEARLGQTDRKRAATGKNAAIKARARQAPAPV